MSEIGWYMNARKIFWFLESVSYLRATPEERMASGEDVSDEDLDRQLDALEMDSRTHDTPYNIVKRKVSRVPSNDPARRMPLGMVS